MNRQLIVFGPKVEVIPLVLLADIPQRIEGTLLVRLVDRNQVGEVEHVDLLQLRCRSVLRSHHIHRHIRVVDDLGVGLADSRSLQENEVESRRPHHIHGVVDMW